MFGFVVQMKLFLLQMPHAHSKSCQFLLLSKTKIISSTEGGGSLVAAIKHRTLLDK